MTSETHAVAAELRVADVEAAICEREPEFYIDHHDWSQDCDGVSQAIVRSGLLPGSRVARGRHAALDEDHSWVVLPDGWVLDATLWSYIDTYPVLYFSNGREYQEQP